MKIIVLFLLISASVFGQTKDGYQEPSKPAQPSSIFQLFDQFSTPPPFNVHEYSLAQLKAFHDYHRSNGMTFDYDWRIVFQSGTSHEQTATVTADGKVLLDGITMEDAFLFMVADQARQSLEKMKEWDRQEKLSDEERKTNPPATLKSAKGTYKITPVDKLPGDILAVTHCRANDIDVLISQGTKRASVLHEMMHVATDCDGSESLHRAIYQLSPLLLKLMQDNPDMVDYLMKRPEKTVFPKVVSAHIVLNSIQAKQQDHAIPECTPNSITTCYDPTLPNLSWHIYGEKQNCEKDEQVKCALLYDGTELRWVPIGKTVVDEESEKP